MDPQLEALKEKEAFLQRELEKQAMEARIKQLEGQLAAGGGVTVSKLLFIFYFNFHNCIQTTINSALEAQRTSIDLKAPQAAMPCIIFTLSCQYLG